MTSIRKAVQRITEDATIFDKGKNRQIIAKLGPGDTIEFRLKGMRGFNDPLELKELFWISLKRTTQRRWTEENKKRQAEGRRPLKKPSSLR